MRILVAEKDRNGRRLLNQMLRMDGHEVYVAEEGAHALSLLQEIKPDVVLMNMFRSLHSECQPVGQIRVHCQEEVSPVVFMTSSGTCDVLESFMAEGGEADADFDRLPLRVKMSAMDHIQKLCSALSHCKRVSRSGMLSAPEAANWCDRLDYA